MFLDLRGFTAFASAEPEGHGRVTSITGHGQAGLRTRGTLDHFTGDGMMVLFNDLVPIENSAERGAHGACHQERVGQMSNAWPSAVR